MGRTDLPCQDINCEGNLEDLHQTHESVICLFALNGKWVLRDTDTQSHFKEQTTLTSDSELGLFMKDSTKWISPSVPPNRWFLQAFTPKPPAKPPGGPGIETLRLNLGDPTDGEAPLQASAHFPHASGEEDLAAGHLNDSPGDQQTPGRAWGCGWVCGWVVGWFRMV